MEVTFNIKIGDVAWLMCDNQARYGIIKNIVYRRFLSYSDYETVNTLESYLVEFDNGANKKTLWCKKDEIFPDKESLIKSL